MDSFYDDPVALACEEPSKVKPYCEYSNDKPEGKERKKNADETFESFIEDSIPYVDNEAAYNHVTGASSADDYLPSKGSQQYNFVRQKKGDEQKVYQTSVTESTQNKRAKHQAMVAQAHAVQRAIINSSLDKPSHGDDIVPQERSQGPIDRTRVSLSITSLSSDNGQVHIPRPPNGSSKKSTTQAHRAARYI